jgi:hypothetical protein
VESKRWAKQRRRPGEVVSNCRKVLEILDLVEELRPLRAPESLLRDRVRLHLSKEYKILNAYWKQRFTFRLCRLGEDNTKFFHACASTRLRKNQIKVLHDGDRVLYNHTEKAELLRDFYVGLLGTSTPPIWGFDLTAVMHRVAGLQGLEAPFTLQEAKDAVWSMRTDSSPGPDGFGPAFFRTFWDVVSPDLMAFLQDFFDGVAPLDGLNRAFISLLPKKDVVLTADGFRPISLQNCVMKVVTRILTTRLQRFIERLISFEQSGFVKGRSIVDNFLYAADVSQSCQTRGTPAVVLKLDFKKAFDSVNWAALDAILEARGIGPLFRSWISTILSTGRTAILLNGVPGRWISCKNGLRQGDPLSPYLYLAVADLLPCLIAMESPEDRLLHPLVDDLPCPVIQYVDDTLLILRAERSQVR